MPTGRGLTVSHDNRGNITASFSDSFTYDVFNRLTSASVSGNTTTLSYDPTGRLRRIATTSETTVDTLYNGQNRMAEYSSGNTLTRCYIPGPGVDEVVSWYTSSDVTTRRHVHANAQGSTIVSSYGHGTAAGTAVQVFSYDPYGTPSSGVGLQLKYTGQYWLEKASLYHYKARAYSPKLGRFLQTDPIGYDDGMNMYAYVGGDPVNATDPMGLCRRSLPTGTAEGGTTEQLTVTACSGGNAFFWHGSGFFEMIAEPGLGNAEYLFRGIAQQIQELRDTLDYEAIRDRFAELSEEIDEFTEPLCEAGNAVAEFSEQVADVSVQGTLLGLSISGAGLVSGQGELIGVGNAITSGSGLLGWAAGGLQFTAGLMQFPGSGDYGNSLNAVASLGTGAFVSRAGSFFAPKNVSKVQRWWHPKPSSATGVGGQDFGGNMAGGVADVANLFSGPRKVQCR